MGLLKYILTEGKKEVIVNKIGLSEKITDQLIQSTDNKFVMYWANLVKTHIDLYGEKSKELFEYDLRRHPLVTNILKMEALIKNSRTPVMPNELKRIFKLPPDKIIEELQWYLKLNIRGGNLQNYIDVINTRYKSIADYASATNQNFQNDNFLEVYEESKRWHEEVEAGASRKTLQIKEGQVVIHEYNDGYYWLDLNTTTCGEEGDSMGHCGNTDAETLLSLRDSKGVPHVTVAYDYDGTVKQIKGKGNTKPVKKYHPYIVDMLINTYSPKPESGESNYNYQFKDYEPEYQPREDFSPLDITDDDLLDKLLNSDKEIIKSWYKDKEEYFIKNEFYIDVVTNETYIDKIKNNINLFDTFFELYDWSTPSSHDSFGRGDFEFSLHYEIENEPSKRFFIYVDHLYNFCKDYTNINSLNNPVDDGNMISKEELVSKVLKKVFGNRPNEIEKVYNKWYKIELDDDIGMDWILYYNGIIEEFPFENITL